MTRGTLQTNINEFYKSMHQEQLPGDSPSATGPWHFRNHQFRKTFAKWVGTGSANSNVALMHHFKHLSIATTDGYIGTDSELYAEIAAYIESSTYNRIHSTLSHVPHIGGLAGAEITNKLNISSAEFMGSEGKEALRYRIDEDLKIAIRAGLTVVDCEFAYCLRRMDNKPKCGGKIARRGPDTCSGCNNFVVTPEHRGWWKQNLENNEDMYQRHINAGASENELLILKDITDKSRTALSKIDKWLETKNGT
jgi:hypothetical protein